MSNIGFIKKFRSQKAKELKRKHTAAFLILDTLAENAKRDSTGDPILEIGEGIVTAEECGISSQQFETGIKFLAINNYIEIMHRGRRDKNSKLQFRADPETTKDSIRIKTRINGTVLKLINSDIYDINIHEAPNQKPNQTRNNSDFAHCEKSDKKKEVKKKEIIIPNPSSFSDAQVPTSLTDDFSFSPQVQEDISKNSSPSSTLPKKNLQHNIQNKTSKKKLTNNKPYQPYPGVFLSQEDYDECIEITGSHEKMCNKIKFIMESPKRKCEIHDWPGALRAWFIKADFKTTIMKNEEMGKRLAEIFWDYSQGNGTRCRVDRCVKKDVQGILFEGLGENCKPLFLSFNDPDFKPKVVNYIRTNKMQQGRISNPYKNYVEDMALNIA